MILTQVLADLNARKISLVSVIQNRISRFSKNKVHVHQGSLTSHD